MKIRRRIWILAAIPMLLSACGKKTAGPMFAQTQVPADLVICTDQEPLVYEPVVKEFEERTGLSVEVKAGTSENVRQMFEQAKDWDLAFGVSTELLTKAPRRQRLQRHSVRWTTAGAHSQSFRWSLCTTRMS